MVALATDKLLKVGNPGSATTLSSPGYTIGATSITVGSTSNWPTDTGVVFAIDEAEVVNGVEVQVAGTYNEYIGTVASGTSITNVDWALGSGDRNYASGALTRVYIPVSAERENRIVEWGLVHADQDGTLKAGAVDNAAVLADDVVETAKIKDGAVTSPKMKHTLVYSHLTSNLVQPMGAGGNFAISNTANFAQISITPAFNSNIFVMAAVNWQRDTANTGLSVFLEIKQGATVVYTGNVIAAQQITANWPLQGSIGQFASTTTGLVTLAAGTTYTLNMWGNIQIGTAGNATFFASSSSVSNTFIGYYLEAA